MPGWLHLDPRASVSGRVSNVQRLEQSAKCCGAGELSVQCTLIQRATAGRAEHSLSLRRQGWNSRDRVDRYPTPREPIRHTADHRPQTAPPHGSSPRNYRFWMNHCRF